MTWQEKVNDGEPDNLHNILYPAKRKALDPGGLKSILPADFTTDMSAWIAKFALFGVPADWRDVVAWDCLTLARANRLHLLTWLTFCEESGISATEASKHNSLWDTLTKDSNWSAEAWAIKVHDVMKWLIKHVKDTAAKKTYEVQKANNKIIFIQDIVFEFSNGTSLKTIDLANSDQSKHQLTWVMRCAQLLGGGEDLALIPTWNEEAWQDHGHYKIPFFSSTDSGAWVILAKEKSRVVIKKTWELPAVQPSDN